MTLALNRDEEFWGDPYRWLQSPFIHGIKHLTASFKPA
jgi:hypothetical protein